MQARKKTLAALKGHVRDSERRHLEAQMESAGLPGEVRVAAEIPMAPKQEPIDNEVGDHLKRAIPSNYAYDPKALKPLAEVLWAMSIALGHAMTAHRKFTKLKSSTISPDGLLGGRGYVMSVKDIRKALYDACEAISAVSDTIHDEVNAPHWKPKLAEMELSDKDNVERLVGESEKNLENPEAEIEDDLYHAEVAGEPADLEADTGMNPDQFDDSVVDENGEGADLSTTDPNADSEQPELSFEEDSELGSEEQPDEWEDDSNPFAVAEDDSNPFDEVDENSEVTDADDESNPFDTEDVSEESEDGTSEEENPFESSEDLEVDEEGNPVEEQPEDADNPFDTEETEDVDAVDETVEPSDESNPFDEDTVEPEVSEEEPNPEDELLGPDEEDTEPDPFADSDSDEEEPDPFSDEEDVSEGVEPEAEQADESEPFQDMEESPEEDAVEVPEEPVSEDTEDDEDDPFSKALDAYYSSENGAEEPVEEPESEPEVEEDSDEESSDETMAAAPQELPIDERFKGTPSEEPFDDEDEGDESDEDEDDEDEDEDDEEDEEDFRSALPDGEDASDNFPQKKQASKFANSSLPVETLSGPRVQHLDRGDVDQTGPFGSYNSEEPHSDSDEWSIDDGAGDKPSYSPDRFRTAVSIIPDSNLESTPTEGYDFGLGYGDGNDAHGQGAGGYANPTSDGKGVYGPASGMPHDPGGKLHDDENDSTPAIELAVGRGKKSALAWKADSKLPNDVQPRSVARSDYYRGDKDSNMFNTVRGESEMPSDPRNDFESPTDMHPGAGYRFEQGAEPYVKWDHSTRNMRVDDNNQRDDQGPYVREG